MSGSGERGQAPVGLLGSCEHGPAPVGPLRSGERGQASVELLGTLPALLALALVALQLLAVGYANVLAGSAAEAGALALATDADPRAGAREALPGWSRAGASVSVAGGQVHVRLRPPSPLRVVARALEVEARAEVALR